MKVSKIKIAFFIITSFLFGSCKKSDVNPSQQVKALSTEAKATLEYLVSLGYQAEALKPNAELQGFMAGDVVYPYVLATNLEKQPLGPTSENQWQNRAVSYANSRAVTYYIDPGFPSAYVGALAWAAYYWSISSPNIRINRTYNRSSADIICNTYYDPNTGGWAYALFPTGSGNVGNNIRINTAKPHDQSQEGKMVLMMHEIGHTLGFRHSDQGGGILIPGTQGIAYHQSRNCGSLMKSSVFVCGWAYNGVKRWTNDDRIMIDWAYRYY
ncbi:MAG TPA: hypothetical protein DCS93_25955 [Microscillaceae bacterium]|nr:hypothetical protein [Microscillaceae bacterium]